MGYKAWQLGEPGGGLYEFYDFLRRRLNRKLVDYLLNTAINGKQCSILEAGSGPAFATSILSRDERIGLAVAIDIDIQALGEARRRDKYLNAVVADLGELPFKDNCMSLTWNSSTLEHLQNPEKSLSEMARVTKVGGNVFVGVPNLHGPLGFQKFVPDTSVGVWVGTAFSRGNLNRLMQTTGLEPSEAIFYFFRFFVGVLARKSSSRKG